MAQCKLTPQEFIKNAFTPQIAVLCSPGVDQVCKKNNLTFVELVQPFCKLTGDASLQDANGGAITIHNLKLSLLDVNFRPPQPTLARKFLNASVSQAAEPRTQTVETGDTTVTVPASTPWFEAWRDMFLQVQFPSDHEFIKHFLACILVVSASEPNPVDALNQLNQTLNQMQNIIPNKLPKWFTSNILRYYVVVHDNVDGHDAKTTQIMESINVTFGIGSCFLLRINSRPPGHSDEPLPDPWSQYINHFDTTEGIKPSPDNSPNTSRLFSRALDTSVTDNGGNTLPYHPLSPDTETHKLNETLEKDNIFPSIPITNMQHGVCLTTNDVEQIKLFLHEFCTRALIPYVERQIQSLTESVSNRKGVSKSLFTATKRWFSPSSKTGTANGATPNMLIYPNDSPELQMRKLGDLYFMFGHYSMAFQAYHSAKRDFNADQAWFYYAGALEMAGFAAFLANESTRKTCDYVEESIVTYLNVCKMAQFATRATLMSSECLKSRLLHGEAAHQLIRMTSEESDLRSALLLEQAAYCFLNSARLQMVRKYAFHMVLAGHRFSKAAQKKHALRCYRQALEVYENKRWTFAEDHVHYTIGKLSAALGEMQEAAESFAKLLTVQTKQSTDQQAIFLKEYLSIQRTLLEKGDIQESLNLLLPLLKSEAIKVLVGPTPPLSIPGKVRALGVTFNTYDDPEGRQKWLKLEEMVVQEAQGSLPLILKPLITLYTKDNIINANLIAIVNEPIQVNLQFQNPLSVGLNLKDVYLLWTFKTETGNVVTNEQKGSTPDSFIKTHVIKSFVMQNSELQELVLCVTPLTTGELILKGVFYTILNIENSEEGSAVVGKQFFNLNSLGITKRDQNKHWTGLPISIMPTAPCLQVNFEDVNIEMLCDQIQPIAMEMRNVGNVPVHKVYMATSTPHLLSSCEFRDRSHKFKEAISPDAPAVREKIARKNHVTQVMVPNGCLEPGQTYSVNVWVKAPNVKGPVWVDLLIYYENSNTSSVPKYRLIRHIWILKVYESLRVNLAVTESCKSEGIKELLFGITAINLNKLYLSTLTEITLLKAGLLSSCWKLKHLENICQSNCLTLHSEQSAYIILKGERRITKYNKYYELPLDSQNVVTKNIAFLDFAKGIEQTRINLFEDPVIAQPLVTREGLLFFQWKARIIDNSKQMKEVSGQSCVAIERFKSPKVDNLAPEGPIAFYDYTVSETETPKSESGITNELRTQISVGITHTSTVFHDFQKSKVCIVPVKITVHNDAHVSSVITINTIGTNSTSSAPIIRPNLFCPYPSKDYRWVGFSGTIKTMPPMSSEVILLCVAVSSPGVYDLGGRLELWCQNDLFEKPVLQVTHALGFLTVRSINN